MLLRAAGLPGRAPAASITGGILAGVLVGPLVFGSVRPDLFESIHVGAADARAELAELDRAHQRDLIALRTTGVSPEAIEEHQRAHAMEREPLREAVQLALARHREPSRLIAAGLVGFSFFLASALARRRRPRALDLREVQPAIGAGLLVALITMLATGVLVAWLLKLDRATSLLIGAATAAGSAFTHLPMRWIGVEGRRIAANAINVFAFVACMMVLILATDAAASAAILLPVGGVFFGGLLRGRVRSTRLRRRAARGAVLWLCAAPLTAYLMSEIDPRLISNSWRTLTFVFLAVSLAGSGHYLGANLALKLFGTPRQHAQATMIWLESHALGVSLTQAMLLVVLVASDALDTDSPAATAVIVGLLLGAAATEMSIALLRRLLRAPNRL